MALQISKQLPGFFQRIGVDWVIGNRTATILLLGIVILGVGLRMIRLQQVHLLERDEIVYLEMAEKWAAEGIDAVYLDTEYTIPPVLLFGMKILIGWGVPGIVAGKLCGMVTGGIFIIPFFFIGKLLFGKNSAGLLLSLLAAVQPYAVRMAPLMERDGINVTWYAFFFWTALYAIQKNKCWSWGLAGGFAALAIFTRHESWELILLTLLYWMVAGILHLFSWKHNLKSFCCFWGGLGLMVMICHWSMKIPDYYYQDNYIRKFEIFLLAQKKR
ncbi:glycosyltransferase family 39 protein [Victivallis sp. Marseille-Q1083]|uniref:glycosyltransferase family 39 protein n=1 Tax=Victivallis sp. Marseille-Q1083 TaxID=2717288 RepID=UPI00158BC797|nr:glycosyltransferase family 39 protein [Victivallis sp. Marseille-Q1083]